MKAMTARITMSIIELLPPSLLSLIFENCSLLVSSRNPVVTCR